MPTKTATPDTTSPRYPLVVKRSELVGETEIGAARFMDEAKQMMLGDLVEHPGAAYDVYKRKPDGQIGRMAEAGWNAMELEPESVRTFESHFGAEYYLGTVSELKATISYVEEPRYNSIEVKHCIIVREGERVRYLRNNGTFK